jgi:hypothetical protein
MANTIRCDDSKYIKNIFDLKGSVINRHVKITKNTKNTSTLKDQNFQYIKKRDQKKGIDFLKFKKEDIKIIFENIV